MSENSSSSQLKCHCGLIASHLTSKTHSNPGRKFFKCPKTKINSCGYWKWEDEVFSDTPLTEVRELVVALDAIKVEMDNLRKEVTKLEAISQSQVIKCQLWKTK
ncbi:uncharacterized protein At1g43920, Chloroplastic-like [Lycium ferocissimum]|uniref:uncharacterized protein At1g43920, Chloroplastic-like n=1 Tax=Lycium ferocissimum TaxID=112874 RepID=UPI002814EADC|nr:uncharacterized protein At1g43920, Chloroplastic-like [Lycium ferocissimum]